LSIFIERNAVGEEFGIERDGLRGLTVVGSAERVEELEAKDDVV
jgi:hypothetical protein